MTIILKNKHSLRIDEFEFQCCIGKNGFTNKKIEGDKKTPKGTFSLEKLYYRSDKLDKPQTKLKCVEIKKNMGWCNDPNHKKYNSLIKVTKKIKHEKMFRKDRKYDLVIILDYNLNKPVPFKCSAIFMHLTKN